MKAYVAYDRRSGIPWASSLDENTAYDYALDHNLTVLEVDFLEDNHE